MSLGLGSTTADIDAFADALRAIAADGPRWTYAVNDETDEYEPDAGPAAASVAARCGWSTTRTATASPRSEALRPVSAYRME